MSMYLYIKEGSRFEVSNDCPDLKKNYDFVTAEVISGTWILYTNANYNDAQQGARPENSMILEAKDGKKPISALNGSARPLQDSVEGVTLFEHYNYGGTSKWVEDSERDLTKFFPPGNSGVSSAIVQAKSQTFIVFDQPNFTGIEARLKPNTRYPNAEAMGFPNDKAKSIRRN